jgi:CMP-N-acetylneuraminic acid synthetase
MIGIIPARSGSKRFPGKNTIDFFGMTLLERTIEQAISSKVFERVIVTSDDPEVNNIARKYPVEIDYRPSTLACDDTRVVDVVKYLFNMPKYQHTESMALLFVTSPFRRIKDIVSASNMFNDGYDSLLTITKYPIAPQFALDFSAGVVNSWHSSDFFLKTTTKQSIEQLYYPNYMIQMATRDVVMSKDGFLGDNCAGMEINPLYSVDIDTPMDYEWAKFLVDSGQVEIDKYLS